MYSSRHPIVRLSCGFALFLTFCASANAASVRQFSPQGEIDQQLRATAVFSENMVPLGKADAPSPFDVDCGEVMS